MGHLSAERIAELQRTAKAIATPGKGLLAADESTGTIKKRFDAIGVENTEGNRMAYRELMFKAPGLKNYISGVILFEETLHQKNAEGVLLVDILKSQGIIPGIKVDKGLVSLAGSHFEIEKATQGLDGLAGRCQDYYAAGARFAKWRAVLSIDQEKGIPSQLCIMETAHTLARYAAICQTCGLVPIVEPEILSDGSHGIEVCAKVTERVLSAVFKALHDHCVMLEGALLKPNMVTQGSECSKKASPDEVGYYTVRSLRRTVPPALAGVLFLSGGQSEEDASLNLNAINKITEAKSTFLSFSYGRALQATCLKEWGGKPANAEAAAKALLKRAEANSLAQLGKYGGGTSGTESLFEKNYAY